MLDGGHIHPKNEHTKPAGIWRKLQTLYSLEALDEREDARQLDRVRIPLRFRGEQSESEDEDSDGSEDADAYSEAANKIGNEDFDLPGQEFAELKWANRLATEKPRKNESPPLLPELNMAGEPPVRFTPSFSIEPSDTATPKSRRGRPRAGTALAKGTPSIGTATSTRRSTRHAESAADEEEKEENEEEEDGDNEESEEDESEASTPPARGTRRSAKSAQNRGAPKARPRGRPRGK